MEIAGRIWLAGRSGSFECDRCRTCPGWWIWMGSARNRAARRATLRAQILWQYDCPVDELLARVRAGEPPPEDLRPALYLEWYSDRNGRVVVQDTRLGVERLGRRTFELTEEDLRREHEEGERRLEELRRQGYVVEETPLGVLMYHQDDAESPWDDSLQAELDREAERIDRAIQQSLEEPPESDETRG